MTRSRVIKVSSSLDWLQRRGLPVEDDPTTKLTLLDSVLTTLPTETEQLFYMLADTVFKKVEPKGYAIFWQGTPAYENGFAFDACGLLGMAALANGNRLLWHRVLTAPGPRIGHLICYGRKPSKAKMAELETPAQSFRAACQFLRDSGVKIVVDPFGRVKDHVLNAASLTGLDAAIIEEIK